LRAAEQDRPDVAEAREDRRKSQPDLNPEQLVFINETGTKMNMVRLYGRAPRGRRLKAAAPFGHWMTTTFVGASRCDQIAAPCVFDGPMNGPCFLAQFLAPALREGDVVVMDNLPSHKVAGVREAIERAGGSLRYRGANLRSPHRSHRSRPRRPQAKGMRKLHRKFRLPSPPILKML
jgi:DDE superfamily endonuclease